MSNAVLLKRPIPQPPILHWDPEASITFRHPGYESTSDILFRLPRLDRINLTSTSTSAATDQTVPRAGLDQTYPAVVEEEAPVVTGVHHGTALLACQIIANNAFDGFLATDRDGQEQVAIGRDEILTADDFWFFANRPHGSLNLVKNRDVYPIVPSFIDWAFPHERFRALNWGPRRHPQLLREPTDAPGGTANSPADREPRPLLTPTPLGPPSIARQTSHRCVLSNASYSLHKAHIIPPAHRKWFGDNDMTKYGRGPRLIDDEANMLHIRHDLHFLWDAHLFALVPKQDCFAIHVLTLPSDSILEFASSWHNIPVRSGGLQQSEPYLFAKFAQAIFMLLKPFVVHPTTHRYVARLRVSTGDPRHEQEVKEEWLSGSSLCDLYSGGGSRSASTSRKRSRSQASSVDLGGCEAEESTWDKRHMRKRRRVEGGNAGLDRDRSRYDWDIHPALLSCDSNDERAAIWYEKNVASDHIRNHTGHSASEDDEAATEWYEENVAGAHISDSDSEDECHRTFRHYKEPERGRPRKRRRRQKHERSEHTIDTLPSLTDTSAICLDDVDPSSDVLV